MQWSSEEIAFFVTQCVYYSQDSELSAFIENILGDIDDNWYNYQPEDLSKNNIKIYLENISESFNAISFYAILSYIVLHNISKLKN